MKWALALLLVLSQVFAVSLTKTVTGPELIDVNETLAVSIGISSEAPTYLERLEDQIPDSFVASGFPASCRQTESTLVCVFGQEISGSVSIGYTLTAIGTGYGMIGSPKLYYEGGTKTIDFFQQYFIGKPRIDLALEGEETLLPGEEIMVSAVLSNPGTRSVEGASLVVTYANETKTEAISLSPEEVIRLDYVLGTAPDKGFLEVSAVVAWGENTVSRKKTVVFISPSIDVTRNVEMKWRVGEDRRLSYYVEVSYNVRNNGTALGNVTFNSGETFEISPGGSRKIVKTYAEKAPAEKISVRDARGVSYGIVAFEEFSPEVKKDFFVLIYEYVASRISPWILAGIFLASLYFTAKFKSPNMKAGFLLIALISGLLLFSYVHVGALGIPGLSPKLSEDLDALQSAVNLSSGLFS